MAWDTSIPVFSPSDVPDEADLNKFINNVNYLKDRDVRYLGINDGSANFTTTSTTFVAIGAPYSYTETMKGGYVLALFHAPTLGGLTTIDFTFAIDGTILGASGTGIYRKRTGVFYHVGMFRFIPVTAGSRTIDVRWKVSSGTATMNTIDRYAYLYIREISWTP